MTLNKLWPEIQEEGANRGKLAPFFIPLKSQPALAKLMLPSQSLYYFHASAERHRGMYYANQLSTCIGDLWIATDVVDVNREWYKRLTVPRKKIKAGRRDEQAMRPLLENQTIFKCSAQGTYLISDCEWGEIYHGKPNIIGRKSIMIMTCDMTQGLQPELQEHLHVYPIDLSLSDEVVLAE